MDYKKFIENGNANLGIEFGSTRIKAVLVDDELNIIAQGDHEWESFLDGKYWSYKQEDIIAGMQDAYLNLSEDVKNKYNATITRLGSLGISGMMHGYIPLNEDDEFLTGFRTWQCTTTGVAAAKLSEEFNFNVPLRWSISHYYQALLDEEAHVNDIAYLTTLAGYITKLLCGEFVLGVGEASGMFPIDPQTNDYDSQMIQKFQDLTGKNIKSILPKVLSAGQLAGTLSDEGAKLLDISGNLQSGAVMAPPEGDAGTGMVATNAISPCTGNVSAGTSIFSMVVMEKPLSRPYEEIDVVATPTGNPVAMVHCNNCTRDLNAWIKIMGQAASTLGAEFDTNTLYTKLFQKALDGAEDCNGISVINYVAGEPITGCNNGAPMVVRKPDKETSLADFMRANLYSAIVTLKIGNEILTKQENVRIKRMTGHGGYFKTPIVGQQFMADALNVPITCLENAGEGGPWGMAILATFTKAKCNGLNTSLDNYLEDKVFSNVGSTILEPKAKGVKGIDTYTENFKNVLSAEKTLVNN